MYTLLTMIMIYFIACIIISQNYYRDEQKPLWIIIGLVIGLAALILSVLFLIITYCP